MNEKMNSASSGITPSTSQKSSSSAIVRFNDCALIEIIHLHDCLRGGLHVLQQDVIELAKQAQCGSTNSSNTSTTSNANASSSSSMYELEKRVEARFKLIWSVFSAHSKAEDEFIWPALQQKLVHLNNNNASGGGCISDRINNIEVNKIEEDESSSSSRTTNNNEESSSSHNINNDYAPKRATKKRSHEEINKSIEQEDQAEPSKKVPKVEQEEYEEDHADEERMFNEMDILLSKLRANLSNRKHYATESCTTSKSKSTSIACKQQPLHELSLSLSNLTAILIQHLHQHLQKEEEQCMPLVKKHLSKDEIHDLVGRIMGKRSSDTVNDILSMAMQNLPNKEKDEMVEYLNQAMVGTFFEKWLVLGGFKSKVNEKKKNHYEDNSNEKKSHILNKITEIKSGSTILCKETNSNDAVQQPTTTAALSSSTPNRIETKSNLETLMRSIASNAELTNMQKTKAMQELRDSQRRLRSNSTSVVCSGVRVKRNTPARSYYKLNDDNSDSKVELVYSSDDVISSNTSSSSSSTSSSKMDIPLFTASELAPTYHDGATGAVLGCPHYARSCKLRHPSSGRLYTCRLCCDQEREMPVKDVDSPFDRYEVTEVHCMICGTLQPVSQSCVNPSCALTTNKKPFSKYFCQICNFYDDSPTKSIYHCPFCNVCRAGKGLGIDFRHCMRCNACVSLKDDNHVCIPQRLQGNCPICHESMFESTQPLRGLRCGHVMHLSCFRSYYMRGQRAYTCPLCKRSVEDMKDYFSLLDTAVRMQPMPAEYLNVKSTIYCQDCCKESKVVYHFVGCKCPSCGSYNTREIERS